MTTIRILAALISALALTGCGSDEPTTGASPEPTTSQTQPADEVTAAAIAEQIGCTKFKPSATPQLYVADQGRCRMGGAEVSVYVFDKQADSDAWWEVAETFGLANLVRSGLVTVDAVNRANRDAVEAALSD